MLAIVAGSNVGYSVPTGAPTEPAGDAVAPRPSGVRMDDNNRVVLVGDADDEDSNDSIDQLVFRLQYENGQATLTPVCFGAGALIPIAPQFVAGITFTINDGTETIRNNRLRDFARNDYWHRKAALGIIPGEEYINAKNFPLNARTRLKAKLYIFNLRMWILGGAGNCR